MTIQSFIVKVFLLGALVFSQGQDTGTCRSSTENTGQKIVDDALDALNCENFTCGKGKCIASYSTRFYFPVLQFCTKRYLT